jgi:hypothetical protein
MQKWKKIDENANDGKCWILLHNNPNFHVHYKMVTKQWKQKYF